MKSLLKKPLNHKNVLRFAPEFGKLANKFVDDILAGKFDHDEAPAATTDHGIELGDRNHGKNIHKIHFRALRSFTLDLIDGPLLRMNLWDKDTDSFADEQDSVDRGEAAISKGNPGENDKEATEKPPPPRDIVLLWMDRIKHGILSIKVTFGPAWMQIWRLNEYGRAINAREHLVHKILANHVEEEDKKIPVQRRAGSTKRDSFATPFPLVAMAMAALDEPFEITGEADDAKRVTRTSSVPMLRSSLNSMRSLKKATSRRSFSERVISSVGNLSKKSDVGSLGSTADLELSPIQAIPEFVPKPADTTELPSLLVQLLRQKDRKGNAMAGTVVTETSFLLWMAMDVGNAWTAMGLHLLAFDHDVCEKVHIELKHIIDENGIDNIFSSSSLSQMKHLDALLYEAIRLCPPFLGGMRKLNETIELEASGVQIPAGTDLIFSKPTEEDFSIANGWDKKPQDLGSDYPNQEIFGFLPLMGLEVPLMVLQSKVLLAVLILRCDMLLSDKVKFVDRMKSKLGSSHDPSNSETPATVVPTNPEEVSKNHNSGQSTKSQSVPNPPEKSESAEIEGVTHSSPRRMPCGSKKDTEIRATPTEAVQEEHVTITQTECMRWFSKIPFPEPRRVLTFREREFTS